MRWLLLFSSFGLCLPPTTGQDMLLQGNMTVDATTELKTTGIATWQFAPGSTVVNNGSIDLGTSTTLLEEPGAPITGTGTERAIWPNVAPLANDQPGGLGLTISSAYDQGGLLVERGHVPAEAANGTPSIQRWYGISTPQPSVATMDIVLHYDLTELNGIMPSSLSIFSAPALVGTWSPSTSAGNIGAQTVETAGLSTTTFITAFDLNAALVVEEMEVDGWRVWPTAIDRELFLSVPTHGPARLAMELMDATGRVVMRQATLTAGNTIRIELPPLVAGAYWLRVNGSITFKLMKA